MASHKYFITWAFERHCSAPHNADFEVCQDRACLRAVAYENAQQSMQADVLVTCANCGVYHSIFIPCPAGSAQVAHR